MYMALAYLLCGFGIVGACVLFWCIMHAWFADNRKLTDEYSRSSQSWNTEHEFFDEITEFRNDFA